MPCGRPSPWAPTKPSSSPDRAFAGADTLATAYTLAEAIQRIGDYDLIICGRQAIDGDTGQVGPGIANRLGIPQLTYVSRIRQIDFENKAITVERLVEEGCEVVVSTLPAVITVNKDCLLYTSPSPRD